SKAPIARSAMPGAPSPARVGLRAGRLRGATLGRDLRSLGSAIPGAGIATAAAAAPERTAPPGPDIRRGRGGGGRRELVAERRGERAVAGGVIPHLLCLGWYL